MARVETSPSLSALVRAEGVVSERALVDAAAGEAVQGSWWGHPASHSIFRALEGLREDPDVFLCKLLDGKQTYVHRRLWPALLRVQAEAALWPALSPAAHQLLQQVEREEAVQATGRLRLELETALRVVARSRHTPSGAHAVVLTAFQSHFSELDREAAARLTLEEAQAALAARPARTPKPSRSGAKPTQRSGKAAPATPRPGRGSTAGRRRRRVKV
ncbi:MAG: hypothetical protein ACLQDQ_04840 [Myxococcaceae bacterium]